MGIHIGAHQVSLFGTSRVAKALWEVGIVADVSENVSIRDGAVEHGCRITMDGGSKPRIAEAWDVVKMPFRLSCAHLSVTASYQGCIFDFLRSSACPGSLDLHDEAR